MIAFGAALSLFLLQNQATGFVVPSASSSIGRNQCFEAASATFTSHKKCGSFRHESLTRRFAALDDDDEDDGFDESGPLAKGIDSVSWLPSVSGAKGDNMPITSTTEVRDMS